MTRNDFRFIGKAPMMDKTFETILELKELKDLKNLSIPKRSVLSCYSKDMSVNKILTSCQ